MSELFALNKITRMKIKQIKKYHQINTIIFVFPIFFAQFFINFLTDHKNRSLTRSPTPTNFNLCCLNLLSLIITSQLMLTAIYLSANINSAITFKCDCEFHSPQLQEITHSTFQRCCLHIMTSIRT